MEVGTHDVDDTFQQTFSPRNQRIDSVIYDLLILAGVDAGFIPLADWQAEAERWASIAHYPNVARAARNTSMVSRSGILGRRMNDGSWNA